MFASFFKELSITILILLSIFMAYVNEEKIVCI
jgi:hypothetical protein